MPTFKEKVADFLRQISSSGPDLKNSLQTSCISPTGGSFIHRYLSGEVKRNQPDILFGKSCYELPVREIAPLSPRVIGAYTGPAGGLTKVNRTQTALNFDVDEYIDEDSMGEQTADDINQNEVLSPSNCGTLTDEPDFLEASADIAGIPCWNQPTPGAYGIATTLYECHPYTGHNAGEPIADAFGICVRGNSALMALADGVNWGEKSCLAARCAVHGCLDYLNKAFYHEGAVINTTLDVFVCLLRSFHAAHNLILAEGGLLTTLCAAVIVQLRDSLNEQFIVCTCNVGDSLAYVFSQRHGVREITHGSHDIYSMRDMRDALGALGPVDGQNPELNNLTVAMTCLEEGDIVFLTSDGISDNFDPVVGKFCMAKKQSKPSKTPGDPLGAQLSTQSSLGAHNLGPQSLTVTCNENRGQSSSAQHPFPALNPFMPLVEAHQRHELTLLRMEDLLRNGVNEGDNPAKNAQELCEMMIDFATKLTVAKRRILEDPDLYQLEGSQPPIPLSREEEVFSNSQAGPQVEQRMRRRKVGEKLAMVPGKLDHASVVACQVTNFLPSKKATLARQMSETGTQCSGQPKTPLGLSPKTRPGPTARPKKEVQKKISLDMESTI